MYFKTKPFDFQLEVFERQKDLTYFAFLWDRGLGKSKATLDSFCYMFRQGKINNVLIIGPKSAVFDWKIKHIPEHLAMGDNEIEIHEWEGMTTKREQRALDELCKFNPNKLKIFIINSEAFQYNKVDTYIPKFLKSGRTYVSIDESHFFKNLTSIRTKKVIKLFKDAPYKRITTGTVMEKPEDLFAQFQFLKDGCLGYTKFTAFKARYCVMKKMKFGHDPTFNQVIGYKNIDELKAKILEIGSVLYKEDVHELPDKIYQTINVKLTPEQKKIYDEMDKDFTATLINEFGEDVDEVNASVAISKAMKLHQITCGVVHAEEDKHIIPGKNPKIDVIKDILSEGAKTIVFCNVRSNFALEYLYDELSKEFTCGKYYGPTPTDERKQMIADFQNGDLQVVIANETAAEGITLTKAKNVIYFSNNHRIIKRDQSEDRAHRVGVEHDVNIIDIVAVGTVDEDIVRCLKNKESIRNALLKKREELLKCRKK